MTKIVKTLRYSKYYLLAAAFLVAFFTTLAYLSALTSNIEDRTESVLHDTNSQIAVTFNQRILEEWSSIAPLAYYAGKSGSDFLHSKELQDRMSDLEESSRYINVFAADATGRTLTTSNADLYVGDRDYFKKAMKGRNAISGLLIGRLTNRPVLVVSVPIRQNNQITGVVCTSMLISDFKVLSDTLIFNGAGDAYVTTERGEPVVGSDPKAGLFQKSSIFDYLSGAGQVKKSRISEIEGGYLSGKEGFFAYKEEGENNYAYYSPLGLNDWYVLCTVPASVVDRQTSSLRSMTSWLAAGLILAFLLILAFVVITNKESRKFLHDKNRELAMSEDRFRLASTLSNNVVVEWDMEEQKITYLTGFDQIASEPVLWNFPDCVIELGLVHEDDIEDFIRMHKDIPKAADSICGEFRFLTKGNRFVWCRVEELLLFDEKGKPIRAIGRITNIEKERAEKETLLAKATMDSGTGLYNKDATRLMIEDCIKCDQNYVDALLLVDIDDFKEINDGRGHVAGDKVLLDMAETMKALFRTTDIIGRIGGDEFIIFVRTVPNQTFLTEKIDSLCRKMLERDDVTISIGVSQYPKDGDDFVSLYHCADLAMYEAKENGKGSFVFFSA